MYTMTKLLSPKNYNERLEMTPEMIYCRLYWRRSMIVSRLLKKWNFFPWFFHRNLLGPPRAKILIFFRGPKGAPFDQFRCSQWSWVMTLGGPKRFLWKNQGKKNHFLRSGKSHGTPLLSLSLLVFDHNFYSSLFGSLLLPFLNVACYFLN